MVSSPDSGTDTSSLRDCEVGSQSSQDTQPGERARSRWRGICSAHVFSQFLMYRQSRTAKQLQSVVKQFGSIGKTVSKKIRRNFGSITRLARTPSCRAQGGGASARGRGGRVVGGGRDHILAAMIHSDKCLPRTQEMIANYLTEARDR